MTERVKPENLAKRGGAWFASGSAEIHLGVEEDFHPAKKAHPALVVSDLDVMRQRCVDAGIEVKPGEPLAGYDRAYVTDPFGNRIELLQPAEFPAPGAPHLLG